MDFLVAGPCALEDDELNLEVAHELARIAERHKLPVIFKGSFDKANRSRRDAPRGPGIERGLEALATVTRETGLRALTDIHEPWQAPLAAEVCDVLQIPAMLSRQTDLIAAAAATGKIVNIKKGQWMRYDDLALSTEKAVGASEVWVTERGNGRPLELDMRFFAEPRLKCRHVFDATHTVASREDTPMMARMAVAAGCDALYIETHPNPDAAPCDGQRMLPLGMLSALVVSIRAFAED